MKCKCGCGQTIAIPKYPSWKIRFINGHYARTQKKPGKEVPCYICGKSIYRRPSRLKRSKFQLCSLKCRGKLVRLLPPNKQPRWKGGRGKTRGGYITICVGKRKRTMEHRLIMKNMLGRFLKKNEVVHHINGDRIDNRPKNLMIMSNSEHMRLHKNLPNR
jgi:hypothetical protein